MKGSPITEELYDYIVDTFAAEDDLLKKLPAEAEAKGDLARSVGLDGARRGGAGERARQCTSPGDTVELRPAM